MSESPLLKYFIDRTDLAISDIRSDVAEIKSVLKDFGVFRDGMARDSKASANWRSSLISGSLSIFTFCSTIGVSIYLGRQERAAIIEAARIEVAAAKRDAKNESATHPMKDSP